MHKIRGKELTCKLFKRHFKWKYLTERYYGENEKEFNDLKIGQMTIEEFVTNL